MTQTRKQSLSSFLVAGTLSWLCSCGPSASTLAPDLPGNGIENLPVQKVSVLPAEPVIVDPWKGRSLIEPPSAEPPSALELPEVTRFTLKN
ncbi:MAG: hypothetical protein GY811_23595, partial [Myxococcales bacterium]|nr:hypothetical protein [Myxococcales bacterium]